MIEFKNVSKTYYIGNESVPALKNIYLKIEKGEFVVIVGPSGSGKSTLLHLLAGLDSPTGGTIFVNGINLNKISDRKLSDYRNREIGLVFQDFKLHPHLNILENVEIPLYFNKKKFLKWLGAKRKAKKILKEFGLGDRITHKPSEISGGQKQRVSIARALINDPPILLADEPTGNLDSITGREIISLLKQLHKEKKNTMIVVTHDKTLTRYASRTIEIKDGKLVTTDNTDKFTH
jgi:putative ABC transport system ATP-binding protein